MTPFQDLRDEFIFTENATAGNWFSLPCLKIHGKVFAALWLNGDLVVKLERADHARALALDGSVLFQPMPDYAPMKEWVQIPEIYADQWADFARSALRYVQRLANTPKKK